MKENEQKEESKNITPSTKPQRKLKFKTLDGKIQHLECDFDIKISELKKKLSSIYNIEPNRQRLLNKGKQFKDDEYLDKLVDKDDTTIHLVFRSEEDVKRAQENSQNNANPNQNQNTQNINPFQNILNVVSNSDEFRNLTNNIVNQIFSAQNNNNNNNNSNTASNNNPNINRNINIQGATTTFQTINLGNALNLSISPLQSPQSTSNTQNPPSLDLNNNNTNNNNNNINENQNANSNTNIDKTYSSQFPITPSQTDKKYEMHLKNIEKELNEADKIISQDIEPKIPLPLLNTTQNVFTAISRSIRKYVIINQNILCNLMRLAELMEREQFITQSEVRMNGNKLLDQAYKSLAHISKASNDLSNVIKSSNFNTAPNMGYIGIICQEIGMQSTAIPMAMGSLNSNSILSALRGRNNQNNNTNNNIIRTTINLNNLGNNQNQANLGNISGASLTSIPISINVIDSSDPPVLNNNSNNNVINNQANTNNIANNNPISNNNLNKEQIKNENKEEKKDENKEEKKDENKEEKKDEKRDENKEEKRDEKKEEISNNNTNSNNIASTNNEQLNNQNNNGNNNSVNQNDMNDLNNLFGTMMNRLMTPENINSISEAVDSMMGNNNNNQANLNFGNLIGNLVNSLTGQENQSNTRSAQPSPNPVHPQQNQTQTQNQESSKPEENLDKNISSFNSNIFKELVDNEELRKKTKVGDEKAIGKTMTPNIEFELFSTDVIKNLTIQDIFDIYHLKFTGLARMRKLIKLKYFSENQKNEEKIKNIIELLCERFILIENDQHILIPDKEFILEDFFNIELKKIIHMLIDDKELNLTDEQWEIKFEKLVIDMLIKLIKEITNIYKTGEEGAKYFMEYNISALIENFIGTKYLNAIKKYDEKIICNFVENLFDIVKNEEIKNKQSNIKKDEIIKKDDNQTERPSLLSVEEIFKIAQKDKEKIEKGNNEENNADKKKYSEFYYLTSLFK